MKFCDLFRKKSEENRQGYKRMPQIVRIYKTEKPNSVKLISIQEWKYK